MNPKKLQPVSGTTRLAGVIGWPIQHTLSPAIQNAAFQFHGLDVAYLPLGVPPEGLRTMVQMLRHCGAAGVNVTVPYKEKIISLLDACAPSAKQMGAVNTIVFSDGKLIGHNTDGFGFLESLKGVIDPSGKKIVLLGGGGGGRAVALSLALKRAGQLSIVDVDPKRLRKLLRDLKALGYSNATGLQPASAELKHALENAALLINATPLGLKPKDPLPLPKAWMLSGRCVMDLVYGQSLTPFLRLAKQRNNRIIPGWKMLLYQGAEAFRLWTGKKPPVSIMQEALVQAGGLMR